MIKEKKKHEKEAPKKEEIKKVQKELPSEAKVSEADRLKQEVSAKEKELGEAKNKLLRALADFDNYKKRIALEREEIIRFSNETLISALLPIIDSFERAIDASKKVNTGEEVIKGLALIKKQFEDTLRKFGAKPIEALGKPFNAEYHEAIMQKESDSPEGVVLEEAQRGYTLHAKVIRPSMVIISKKKESQGKEG